MITPICPLGLVITDPSLGTSQLYDYIEAVKPAAISVVEGAELVHQLCDRYPKLTVIARHYWPQEGDDNAHVKTHGEAWAYECDRWLDSDTRPWLYWCNEPTQNNPRLVVETLAAYEAASKLGYRVVGPNFGTRWPSNQNLAYFGTVYRACAVLDHRIGIHAYGGRTMYPDVVMVGEQEWHIGRLWFTDRMEGMLAIEPGLRFMVTETGLDKFVQIPGSGPYRDHGLAGHIYAQQLIYAWEKYWHNLPVDSALVFSWGEGRWQQYSVRGEVLFKRELATHSWQSIPPVPEPPSPSPPDPDPDPEPNGDDEMDDIGQLTLQQMKDMTREQLLDLLMRLLGAQTHGQLAGQVVQLFIDGEPVTAPVPGPAPVPDPQPGPGIDLLYNIRIDKQANTDRTTWHGAFPRIFFNGLEAVALSGRVGGYSVPEADFLAEPKTTAGDVTNSAEGWREYPQAQEMKVEAGQGGLRLQNVNPVDVLAGAEVTISVAFYPFVFAAAADPENNPPPTDGGVYDSKRVDVDVNLRDDWYEVCALRLVALDEAGSYLHEGDWQDGGLVFAHTGRASWRVLPDTPIKLRSVWTPSVAQRVRFGFEVIMREQLALQSWWTTSVRAVQ